MPRNRRKENMPHKKSLTGYTWTNHWSYWLKYEKNGFLTFPEVVKNSRVYCLSPEGRKMKIKITIEEIKCQPR